MILDTLSRVVAERDQLLKDNERLRKALEGCCTEIEELMRDTYGSNANKALAGNDVLGRLIDATLNEKE